MFHLATLSSPDYHDPWAPTPVGAIRGRYSRRLYTVLSACLRDEPDRRPRADLLLNLISKLETTLLEGMKSEDTAQGQLHNQLFTSRPGGDYRIGMMYAGPDWGKEGPKDNTTGMPVKRAAPSPKSGPTWTSPGSVPSGLRNGVRSSGRGISGIPSVPSAGSG